MNHGKLEVVKQELTRVNINILGISELKWTGMGEFNSDGHYINYMGKNPLEEMKQSSKSTKESKMQYLGTISKMTEWFLFISKASSSVPQQSKSMPQPVMLKKLKLNGSMKTYKTFWN